MFRTGSIVVSMERLLRAAGIDVTLEPVPSLGAGPDGEVLSDGLKRTSGIR